MGVGYRTFGINERKAGFRLITSWYKCPNEIGITLVEDELSGSVDDKPRTVGLIDVHTYLLAVGREDDDVVVDIAGVHHPQVTLSIVYGAVQTGVSAGIIGSRSTDDGVGRIPALDALVIQKLVQSRTVRSDEIMCCVLRINGYVHKVNTHAAYLLDYVLLRNIVPR